MTFRLKDPIHRALAETVFDDLFTKRSNYYYFIGKVIPWETPGSPPEVPDSRFYSDDLRNRIVSIKKVGVTDISFVIPRKNWASGTIYDQFDDYYEDYPAHSGATSLKTSNFYVLTSEFKVFKCISNNRNSESTVEPSATDLTTTTLSDGYVWKFMYILPLSLRTRFLTSDFMPVQKSVKNAFYSDGQIDAVTVSNRGSGYSGNAKVRLTFDAPGNITFGFRGSPGADGNITPIISPSITNAGRFDKIIINNVGNNILAANIAIIDIDNDGSNLFPNVKVGNTLHIGTGNAILLPVLQDGKMESVAIADPGTGYSSNIQTTLTINGDGSNAQLAAYVNDAGELEDVIIENRGEGYTFVDINVVSTTGSGAVANVDLSSGDLDTLQSTVELSAVNGGIHNFRINSGGSNYSNTANVTIEVTGDGVDFAGNVILDDNNNTVKNIVVVNPGTGYTFANVQIKDSANVGTGANISAILSPQGGHGFDAVSELFGETLTLFSTINNEKIHNTNVDNDFRQFGIIRNIEQKNSRKLFSNSSGTPCFLASFNTVETSSGVNLTKDTVLDLKGTDRQFEVVEVVPSTKQMVLTSLNNHTLVAEDTLNDSITDKDFVVSSVTGSPDINKFSGELLYIDNRTATSFTDEQLVTLRAILKL
tara:strand:- start:2991 stop:4940 length:1950 start_codon:yes stop_codon:yes gene_type:complete